MKKDIKKTAFVVLATLFLFLLSFQLTLEFTEKTEEQETVFAFLAGEEQAENEELKAVSSKQKADGGEQIPSLALESYTPQEIAHLEDVKHLMEKTDLLFYALIPILTLLFLRLRKEKEELLSASLTTGKVVIVLAALLRFFTLFFFEQTFVAFHLIFFPQGNWMFPEGSLLIATFPLEFFTLFVRQWLFFALLMGSIFIVLPLLWKYVQRKWKKG